MKKEARPTGRFVCGQCGAEEHTETREIDQERETVRTEAARFVTAYGAFGTKSRAAVPEALPVGVRIDQRTKRPAMDPGALQESRYITCGCGFRAYLAGWKRTATA